MAKRDPSKKSISDVLEASSNIHNRLFNHKHFIDGEINYLINKTEKNDCKEIDRLLNQLQDKHQNRLFQVNECKNLINRHKLDEFCKKSEDLLRKSNEILKLDEVNEEKRKLTIEEHAEHRRAKEEEIRRHNQGKLDEVDRFYEGKKIEAAKYYNELEAKWDV